MTVFSLPLPNPVRSKAKTCYLKRTNVKCHPHVVLALKWLSMAWRPDPSVGRNGMWTGRSWRSQQDGRGLLYKDRRSRITHGATGKDCTMGWFTPGYRTSNVVFMLSSRHSSSAHVLLSTLLCLWCCSVLREDSCYSSCFKVLNIP